MDFKVLSAFLTRKPVGESGTLFMCCVPSLAHWDKGLGTDPVVLLLGSPAPEKGFVFHVQCCQAC